MALHINLKQHTPIIHFQHGQPGATLRATEFKPKLDRFLKGKVDANLYTDKGNLPYKVRIVSKNQQVTPIKNRHPLFFGNLGVREGDAGYKKFVDAGTVSMRFMSFHPGIPAAIEKNLDGFLASTNFGTRQSKGFGSFFIEGKRFDPRRIEGDVTRIYRFQTDKGHWEDDIALVYSMLRSGINEVNRQRRTVFYGKSLMFLYAKTKNITWDKKAIKQHYFLTDLNRHKRDHPNADILTHESEQTFLMRDLLGLSTEQVWLQSGRAKITKSHDTIERFQSPIMFKPVQNGNGYDVYLWGRQTDGNILSNTFSIRKNGGGNLQLRTPPAFDLEDFLAFAFQTDLGNHIHQDYHGHWKFRRLDKMFKQLRNAI